VNRLIDPRWSLIDPHWSLIDPRWSLWRSPCAACLLAAEQSVPVVR